MNNQCKFYVQGAGWDTLIEESSATSAATKAFEVAYIEYGKNIKVSPSIIVVDLCKTIEGNCNESLKFLDTPSVLADAGLHQLQSNSRKLYWEMTKTKILGLCGAARSGKDTFFEFAEYLLKKDRKKCKRIAFADELKKDVDPFVFKKTGISAWTSDEKEKRIIRPILVSYGEVMRDITEGQYWIDKIKPKLDLNTRLGYISVVTDVRYENEISFLKEYEGSKCIYIERLGVDPANEQEEANDPTLRTASSELIKWRSFGPAELHRCGPIVKSMLKKLNIIEK